MSLYSNSTVQVSPGLDLGRLNLSDAHLSFFSIVKKQPITLVEVARRADLSIKKTRAAIEEMIDDGVLEVVEQEEDEEKDFEYNQRLLDEDCALTLEEKKRILLFEASLDKWTYYRILGILRTSTEMQIKRGYRDASKEFHPDAFFRKDIGSYAARVNRIFVAMKKSYEVLRETKSRAEYDESISHIAYSKEEMAVIDREEREKELIEEAHARERRHEKRREARRINRNPLVQRLRKARDFLRLAEKALADGKTDEAGRHARLAKQFAPRDPKIVSLCNDIIGGTNVGRARAIASRGDDFIARNDIKGVHQTVEDVLKLAPHDPQAIAAVASLLMKIGEREDALEHAKKAVELDPGLKRAWFTLLDASELTQNWKTAEKAAKSILHFDPENAKVQKRLRKASRESRRRQA